MKFYKVTEDYLGSKFVFEPKVPSNYFTKNNLEDNTTKRVCVCKSIDECLLAMGKPLENKILYVYSVWTSVGIKAGLVPDKEITNEYWILQPLRFKLENSIKISEPLKNSNFLIGLEEFELWSFKYEKILNKNTINM